MRSDKVNCPLLECELDEEICEDAAFAAEEIHPERFAPKIIRALKNWASTCRECPDNPCNEK